MTFPGAQLPSATRQTLSRIAPPRSGATRSVGHCERPTPPMALEHPRKRSNGDFTVLVADDEVHIVEFLALLLEDEGCRVLRAFDGIRAWELSEAHRPDLIISDVMMPGMTGVDLAKRIRAARNGSSPRIVLMSAVAGMAALPGVGFLLKPFDIDHILDLIDDAVDGISP